MISGRSPVEYVPRVYLGQIPPLLFATDVWQEARHRLGGAPDGKQRLQSAIGQIAPVRNEIAHVREVDRDRLLRASIACADVLNMLKAVPESGPIALTERVAPIASVMTKSGRCFGASKRGTLTNNPIKRSDIL